MTSERPGSAALALQAGAAGPGAAGRGLKLKGDEMGAIPSSLRKPGVKSGVQALHPLRARPGGKGFESRAEGWKEGGSGYGAGFRDQGQSPQPLEKEGEGRPRTPGLPHPGL